MASTGLNLLLLSLLSAHLAAGGGDECPHLLGLSSGSIQDWQIASSSSLNSENGKDVNVCQPKFGRLYQNGDKAWCSKHRSVGEWILVDLGVISQVSGIMTQGREQAEEWVTWYSISYSTDAFKWHFASDASGNRKVFRGNVDASTVRYNFLEQPLETRFIRLHVIEWKGRPSLRLELVGFQECNGVVTESPNVKLIASSTPTAAKKTNCRPDSAHLFSHSGWCAKRNDENQWLQYDVGPPRQITGIVTRGHGGWEHRRHTAWVTSYTLSYSNDTLVWFSYRDGNHLDPKVFGGNMNKDTERRHYLNHPFAARYIRIHPITWHRAIAMRAALLGCPHKGDCGPEFFQVNPVSGCIENLAFHHNTWLNDKRHLWKDWKYGRANLAVDGSTESTLHRCAIVDNYFVEQPIWMVDLGHKHSINGVIIVTWQGKGQDKTASYRDYQSSMEKLSVYVSNKPRLEAVDLVSEPECGWVGRVNETIFQPRVHVQCHDDVRGRYVYILASAVATRKSRLFFAVLCEVIVY